MKQLTSLRFSEANLVRLLHIISLVAVISAGLLFIYIGIFGVPTNDHINEIMNSPIVTERFIEKRTQTTENMSLLLRQQAETFARYLDARKEIQGVITENESDNATSERSVNFNICCTSYCESNPKMSLALIDEPGEKRYWVRQSDTIGHFFIEQIKDGFVIATNGKETFKFTLGQRSETSLPKEVPQIYSGIVGQENSLAKSFRVVCKPKI